MNWPFLGLVCRGHSWSKDRKTIFETLSLPVAKILSPVARHKSGFSGRGCPKNSALKTGSNLGHAILFLKYFLPFPAGFQEPLLGQSQIPAFLGHFVRDAAFLLTVGSFLLTMELFYLQLTTLAFLLTIGAFLLTTLAFLLTIGASLLTVGKCV